MKRYDPEIVYEPYHPGPQAGMEECTHGEYVKYEDAAARIKELEDVLRSTRVIICEGAAEGFNYEVGDWAERLYANNGAISKVID